MQDPAFGMASAATFDAGRWAALFDRSPNFIALLQGAKHRFVYANPRYAAVVGGREVMGRTLAEALPEAVEQGFGSLLDGVYQSGQAYSADSAAYIATDADGRTVERFVDFVYQPVCGSDGAVQGILVLGTDVTERVRSTVLLQRHAAAFEQLVSGIPFGLYVADADFVVRQASEVALRTFGSVEPLLGRDLAEALRTIWPEPFASDAIGRFRHTLATGEPYHAPSTVERRADMDAVEAYDWRIERILMPDGRPGVACYFYDLSARQRYEAALRSSEQRLAAVLGSVQELIWGLDREGRCIFANERQLGLWGLPYAEALGRTIAELGYDEQARSVLTEGVTHVVTTGTAHESVTAYTDGAGHTSYHENLLAPVRDAAGNVAWVVGSSRDVTRRLHDEQRLRAQDEALRAADRQKDVFLATLSHELRNPLAPIRNAAHVLGSVPLAGAQLQWATGVIQRQVSHMAALLDDLLDVARITQQKLQLHPARVSLAAVVEAAVETAQPRLDGAGQRLVRALPPADVWLHADPVRLSQVLANLLANAAKYSDPGSTVTLTATIEDAGLWLRVRDTGIGIPSAALGQVFELFAQVEGSRDRSEGGLGIGLALAKGIVELHGGRIAAASGGPGQGSEFSVWLPLPAADAGDPAPARAGRPDAARRVLVVDDNEDAAESLAMLLQLYGHEVRTAYDGPRALVVAGEFGPDTALLDLSMRGMDGHALARALRAAPGGAALLLVALSGRGLDEDKRQSAAAGFDHHLTKPVDPLVLQRLLAQG